MGNGKWVMGKRFIAVFRKVIEIIKRKINEEGINLNSLITKEMKHIIEIDDEQPNGLLVIELLKALNLDYKQIKTNKLTDSNIAFGIGRSATNEEIETYIQDVEQSPAITLNEAYERFNK